MRTARQRIVEGALLLAGACAFIALVQWLLHAAGRSAIYGSLGIDGLLVNCRVETLFVVECTRLLEVAPREWTSTAIMTAAGSVGALVLAAARRFYRDSVFYPFAYLAIAVLFLCLAIDVIFAEPIEEQSPLIRWQFLVNSALASVFFIAANFVGWGLRATAWSWAFVYSSFVLLIFYYLAIDIVIRLATYYAYGGFVMFLIWSFSIMLNFMLLISANMVAFSWLRLGKN